jgi:B9 domain-containing protein 1
MQTNDRVVWNFPFELIYRTNDIAGWPKICLTLTSRDFLGRDVVCGYGIIHVPT